MKHSLKIGIGQPVGPVKPVKFDAFSVLGSRNGFAIDFRTGKMVVHDSITHGNAYAGPPEGKLTKYGVDPWLIDPLMGLDLSAARDFSIAMATNAFPYDPGAIHVYARFRLNGADSLTQRYLFMVNNVGPNRFAVYTTSGAGFRWVTADGVAADTEISNLPLVAGVEYRTVFGADAFGRAWIDVAGVQTNDQLFQIAAANPSHIGLGGYPDRVLRVLDGHLAEIAVVCGDIPLEKRLSLAPFPPLYGAEGDSHTFNVSFGMPESAFYPARVGAAVSGGLALRNAGGSGESSAQMVAQVTAFLSKGAPDVATIYAGSNDVDTAVSVTGSAVSFDVADASKMAVGGYIQINAETRQIAIITGNTITLTVPLTVVPIIGDVVAIDTEANIRAWVQTVRAAGAGKIAVIGSHYLNFAIAGDTPNAEQSLRGAVRQRQKSAALAEGVPYIDTYAHMRGLILAGQVAQGDWAAWHQGASNTHLNAAGEQVLADAVRAAMFT